MRCVGMGRLLEQRSGTCNCDGSDERAAKSGVLRKVFDHQSG